MKGVLSMKMTQLSAKQLEIIAHNNGMQRYLRSLLEGRSATPRSWLYEDQSAENVQKNWLAKLDSLQVGTTFEQGVYQFDTSQLSKWGPQGEIAPIGSLLKEVVLPSFEDHGKPEAFSSSEWTSAKLRVWETLAAHKIFALRPASYESVVDDMRARDVLESNSGWPLFTRRNKSEVKAASVADAESGAWREYPAIALFRNYRQKTRLVWMFPMSANLVEGSYYQPLYAALASKNFSFLSPWHGFSQVRSVVTKSYGEGDVIAASDFSSTDAHFQRYATEEVADVLELCFQPQYRGGLRESLLHMHSIPLVIGPDRMITGEHGVSSGSNWTNFVETIFDWIFSWYVTFKDDPSFNHGKNIYSSRQRIGGLYAIGDDMSWWMDNYDAAFAKRLEAYGKQVGQVIKAEKTTNDEDKVKSLQRLFQRGYMTQDGKEVRGVYSTIRALNSSLYPERFHRPKDWNADMFCIRQFMILENCVDHPLFEEFVRFVCTGNRHLPEFARKSAGYQEQALRKSKLLPGLNTTYNQEKRDSKLSSFDSIRIAATL
nr:MAG: putative RNA-dependent RNA polymerase [Picobirnavirus sp.]